MRSGSVLIAIIVKRLRKKMSKNLRKNMKPSKWSLEALGINNVLFSRTRDK